MRHFHRGPKDERVDHDRPKTAVPFMHVPHILLTHVGHVELHRRPWNFEFLHEPSRTNLWSILYVYCRGYRVVYMAVHCTAKRIYIPAYSSWKIIRHVLILNSDFKSPIFNKILASIIAKLFLKILWGPGKMPQTVYICKNCNDNGWFVQK